MTAASAWRWVVSPGPACLRGSRPGSCSWLAISRLALLLFRFAAVWLPVLIPLVLQAPAGILYAITHHYRDMGRKRDELAPLFGKFVPDRVIEAC